jgi:hypothetical protein
MAFSVDSTLRELMENPSTHEFLEKNMPELLQHPALSMIRNMSLRQIAPFSEGKLTDEVLAQIDENLKGL